MDSLPDSGGPAGTYFRLFQRLIEELKKKPGLALDFSFQDRTRFQCSACGQCCRQPWKIVLPKDYYEQWFAYFDTHPSGRFAEPFGILPSPTPGQYADMRRQPDSHACIFLEEDNQCFIHRHLGPQALPDICRTYPRVSASIDKRFYFTALLPSCYDVPGLWQETPRLQYRFVAKGDLAAPEIFALAVPVQDGCFLRSYSFYLWLGIVLDTFGHFPASPLHNFSLLGHALSLLLLCQRPYIPEGFMSRVHREQLRHIAHPGSLASQDSPEHWLSLAASMDYPDGSQIKMTTLYQDFSSSLAPPLQEPERELLADFLRNYLHYSLFLSKNWLSGQLNLLQQHLMMAFSLAFIQLLALYERQQAGTSLQIGHLRRSVNFVANLIEHKEDWSAHPIHTLTPQHCLEGISGLAQVDFTQC